MRRKWLLFFLLIIAGSQLWLGCYIPAKAQLAQWLLQRAWQQSQIQPAAIPPWPWADTWPVARLQIPQQHIDLIIVNGDSGAALAFAPGLRQLDAAGQVMMISGHRDTHFRFMQQLHQQETMTLLHHDGQQQHFRIVEQKIVDSRKPLQLQTTDAALLLMVTCYPFNAIQPGGPLRFMVIAREVFTHKRHTTTAHAKGRSHHV